MLRKVLAAISLFLLMPCAAQADCSSRLTGLFTSYQARKLCAEFPITLDSSSNTEIRSATGKNIELKAANETDTALTLSRTSDSTVFVYGDGSITRGHLDIRGATSDGDDDGYIIIGAGGGNNLERGAAIVIYGNETTGGNEGDLKLDCGNVSGADVEIITPVTLGQTNYRKRWYWPAHSGNMYSDDTYGGSIIFQNPGTGVTDKVGDLAATGANQSAAAMIVARATMVTGADGAVGVKFNADPTVGDHYRIYNTANAVLLVYPGANDYINANAQNAAVSVAAYGTIDCHCSATSPTVSQWWCGEEANP